MMLDIYVQYPLEFAPVQLTNFADFIIFDRHHGLYGLARSLGMGGQHLRNQACL
jgi:hypothetical protein